MMFQIRVDRGCGASRILRDYVRRVPCPPTPAESRKFDQIATKTYYSSLMRPRAKRQSVRLVRCLFVVTLVVGAIAGGVSSSASAGPFPPGSIKLQPSQIRKSGGVTCGFVKASWVPGTRYTGGRFLSRVTQERNLRASARKASGTSRTALLKSATQFAVKAKKERIVCASLPKPSTYNPPTNPFVPVTTTPSTSATTPSTQSTLKFNIKNAVGLTLKSSVSSSSVRAMAGSSNLQSVDASGNVADAVTAGSASISRFLIAPNDKLYVVFNSKTTIGSTSCILAEVAKATGDPTCIESDLSSIVWTDLTNYEFDPIQFDDAGAIYYAGSTVDGKSTIRRYRDGVATSLVTDNVNNLRFLTLADGRVLVGGTTTSSSSSWTRLINTSGGLQTVVAGSYPNFLSRFPDGNVYLGYWMDGNGVMGIKRYLSATSTMDSTYWISGNTNGVSRPSFFDVGAASSTPQRIQALEAYYGTRVRQLVATTDNKMFAITGSTPTLVQYYPSVSQPSTAVTAVGVMQRVLTYIILSGTNSNGQNITTLYNTATDTEQTLIPSTNEIEIYHLNYVASTNKIMFDGLRFSDNKYVLGQIDLNTGQVTASQTGSSKLVDFKTFAS